jgi:tetratricopeptide (TPR) repeat protein
MIFEDTVRLIATLGGRHPSDHLPKRLDNLFHDLASTEPVRPHQEIEDRIWALWIAHDEPEAAKRMERAIAALGERDYPAAERLLDALVASYPDWAEVWNKRATLYYLVKRDRESVADIGRTLALEPRHFGALCGFGQICLRQGDEGAALVAFEAALAIHPHLPGIRPVVEALGRRGKRTIN